MLDKINTFVDEMLKAQEKFNKLAQEFRKKEQGIDQEFEQLEIDFKQIFSGATELNYQYNKNSTIGNLLQSNIEIMKQFLVQGKKSISEGKEGFEFIEEFEKYFIVAVFGKVKSGKSTLGNFFIGNWLEDEKIASSYDKINPRPTIKLYKANEKFENKDADGSREFYVNQLEATSTIQSFFLGGLAWFDTPGIGSVTQTNEDLAEKYIKNADLVVFSCSSDAAGTTQEFEEMRDLHQMGKPILLVVTMSDTYDEDVNEEGEIIKVIVPKSAKDRQDVEEHLRTSLQEMKISGLLEHSDILTVSTLLAKEALLTNNEELFRDSNVEQLIKILIGITRDKSEKFKMENPKKRINTLINDLVGREGQTNQTSLRSLQAYILNFKQNIQEQEENLKTLKTNIIETTKNKCAVAIQDMMLEYSQQLKSTQESVAAEVIAEHTNEIIMDEFHKQCNERFADYLGQIEKKNISLGNKLGLEVNLENVTEKISYEVTKVRLVERDPKGLIEHVGSFFGKTYHRTKTTTETRYQSIDIGTNEAELTRSIINKLDSYCQEQLDQASKSLIEGYFNQIKTLIEKLENTIQASIARLEGMKVK